MERYEEDKPSEDTGSRGLGRWLGGGMQMLGRGVRLVSDLVMPPVCLSCRRLLDRHHSLCGRCWGKLQFIRPPLCDVLGLPMPFDPGGRIVSAAALADPPAYDRARAVGAYGEVMRGLIHSFKYSDHHETRHLFARWLIEAGADLLADADMIVPVPLHRWRLMRRTFNQAAVLGCDVARTSGVAFEPLVLKRIRNTRSQVGLTTDQRRRNISGAFAVSLSGRRRLAGKRVLLIDDVITTGATVSACARVLKRAGAKHVDVLALAIVVPGLDFSL